MGRSSKLMKRPTKAEKVARSINKPVGLPSRTERIRSLSPETETRSTIPLFNTSAKRLKARLADYDPMSLDSSKVNSPAVSDKEMEPEAEEASGSAGEKKTPKSLKDKIKRAKDAVAQQETKSKKKLGVLGGVDYLKLHEKGGSHFKKKLR